jgi:hypothetical protein
MMACFVMNWTPSFCAKVEVFLMLNNPTIKTGHFVIDLSHFYPFCKAWFKLFGHDAIIPETTDK